MPWTISLEDHDDDYKRAETSSTVIGIYTTRKEAFIKGVSVQIDNEHFVEMFQDNLEHKLVTQLQTSRLAKKKCVKRSPEEQNEFYEQFVKTIKQVIDATNDDDFNTAIENFDELVDTYYGKPEFTMKSSGTRLMIEEVTSNSVENEEYLFEKLKSLKILPTNN